VLKPRKKNAENAETQRAQREKGIITMNLLTMMQFIRCPLAVLVLLLAVFKISAQEPLDGPTRIFNDALLDDLAGEWKLKRQIRGRNIENTVSAEWVLNHQF